MKPFKMPVTRSVDSKEVVYNAPVTLITVFNKILAAFLYGCSKSNV